MNRFLIFHFRQFSFSFLSTSIKKWCWTQHVGHSGENAGLLPPPNQEVMLLGLSVCKFWKHFDELSEGTW